MQQTIENYRPEFERALSADDYERATTIAMFVAGELLSRTGDVGDELRWTLWNELFSHLHHRYAAQYQSYDFEIVDYRMYSIVPGGILFRGPRPLMSRLATGQYYTFCGAAQLFGRFHSHALHTMVGQELGCDTVNMSVGGAGPQYFFREDLLDIVNSSLGAVLQVLSGRSVGCDEYPGGRLTSRNGTGPQVDRLRLLEEIWEHSRPEAIRLVGKWRTSYLALMHQLIDKIHVPIVLLWLSNRAPSAWSKETLEEGCDFGSFPHLIDAQMAEELANRCANFVVISEDPSAGHGFVSRFTGKPCPFLTHWGKLYWSNRVYPSADVTLSALPGVTAALRSASKRT